MLQWLRQNLFSSRALNGFLALSVGFFLLYALTAQRGWGWGDSAEFHDWVLNHDALICGPHFSNAHPLYVCFCRFVAGTPFAVTLVSALFGALSVGGLFLCTKRFGLSIVFGLSHMLWWNSCLAEVQTMNLAFIAFEAVLLLRFLDRGEWLWFAGLVFLNGVHLNAHNLALLAVPVYAAAFFVRARGRGLALTLPFAALWALGACGWIWAAWTRGVSDVLVGAYGGKVFGLLPANGTLTAFNFALAALSFFSPAAIWWWTRCRPKNIYVWALFSVNLLFWVKYFIPDQATFLLPTLFFAYVLVSCAKLGRKRLVALAALQLLLPLMAWQVLEMLPRPGWKTAHEGRNDAAYFALPWKIGVAK